MLLLEQSKKLLIFVSTVASDPIFWQINGMTLQGYLQSYLEFLFGLEFGGLSISQYHQTQTEIVLICFSFCIA